MFVEVSNKELEKYKEISKITITDYEFKGNFVPVVSLIAMIDDLLIEVHDRDEKIKDMEENVKENYKPISQLRHYGMDDSDFI